MQHTTPIPQCLGDTPQILRLFLTSTPTYVVALPSPLSSSNHSLLSILSHFSNPQTRPKLKEWDKYLETSLFNEFGSWVDVNTEAGRHGFPEYTTDRDEWSCKKKRS